MTLPQPHNRLAGAAVFGTRKEKFGNIWSGGEFFLHHRLQYAVPFPVYNRKFLHIVHQRKVKLGLQMLFRFVKPHSNEAKLKFRAAFPVQLRLDHNLRRWQWRGGLLDRLKFVGGKSHFNSINRNQLVLFFLSDNDAAPVQMGDKYFHAIGQRLG